MLAELAQALDYACITVRRLLKQIGYFRSYTDTYHGQVSTLGYTYTAKCYDCHGSHKIQRVDDPTSTVSQYPISRHRSMGATRSATSLPVSTR